MRYNIFIYIYMYVNYMLIMCYYLLRQISNLQHSEKEMF